jgi:hypothetical protein
MVLFLITGSALGDGVDATVSTVVASVPLAIVAVWLILTGRSGNVPART